MRRSASLPLAALPLAALLLAACSDAGPAGDAGSIVAPAAPGARVPAADLVALDTGLPAPAPAPGAPSCLITRLMDKSGQVKTVKKGNCRCTTGSTVVVTASVWGGVAGNTVTGRATCGTSPVITVVGPVVATDPGSGGLDGNAAAGPQKSGAANCGVGGVDAAGAAKSTRKVSCVFF